MTKESDTPQAGDGKAEDVVGVLLAGGLSRRMGGGDKSLATLAGRPMLAHAAERLGAQVRSLVINANGNPARFAAFGLPVVPDTLEGYPGPLAGVLAGMLWARKHAPQARFVASAAADTPFFPRDLVGRFVREAETRGAAIALAASGGHRHPVFGLWSVALADDLAEALAQDGVRKVVLWVERHPNVTTEFPIPLVEGRPRDPFFNVNTPEELTEAETWARGPVAPGAALGV